MEWVGRLPKLESLNLNYTPVTDAGFAKLSSNTNFSELKLDRTDLADKSLAWLTSQKNLKYIDLLPHADDRARYQSAQEGAAESGDQLEPRREPGRGGEHSECDTIDTFGGARGRA